MTKIVHPYAHRLGIIKDWKSRWFSINADFRLNLKGDMLMRDWLTKNLKNQYIGLVEIERSAKAIKVIINTSRPGVVIGKSGDGVIKIKKALEKILLKIGEKAPNLQIEVVEIKNPEGNASIVSQMIAEGIEKRLPYRRVLKQTVEKVMAVKDIKGIRIYLGGRLAGADMARSEEIKRGRIPLQTIRADIDYARHKAHMPYGDLGIKVWIYKGDIFNKTQK
ncbi:30S ribosomal protein S3 [Arenimonas sp.]|nr:30S ribosomal protein S3 [Candidatus Parcubacteria bacterium]